MSITVTNNPDGTYTVECNGEIAVVGQARGPIIFPSLSSSGGGVVAYISDLHGKRSRGKRVENVKEIIATLKTPSFRSARAKAGARPIEFSLHGQHSIDIGKIRSAIGAKGKTGQPKVRIFVRTPHE
jgi:hypothetical protein